MLGTATAAVVVAGVAVARGGVPSWVVFPAGLTSAVMVLACLALVERQPRERHAAVPGTEQRRQLELLPGAEVGPAEITALDTKWARPTDQAEAFYFRRIPDPAGGSAADGPADTTIAAVEAEVPGGGDNLSFRWRNESLDGAPVSDPMPPPDEEPVTQAPPQEPPAGWEAPPPRPDPSARYEYPPEPSYTQRQASDVYDLHADVRDLMRMSRTMLDTLAAQLKQNEESARLVTGHLSSTESQLSNMAERLRTLTEGMTQPPPIALDAERLAHGVRRVEARLQSLVDGMERQGATSGVGVMAEAATLRQKQGEIATALSDVAATQQAMQVNLGALRNEEMVAARSMQSDLSSMAVQAGELRQAQADFTAVLSEQAAALRSMQADIAQTPGGQASIDRYVTTVADVVRRTVGEELRREGPGGTSVDAALTDQASALRSLQGDLTSILSEQAAAIRSLQANSAGGGVQQADLDRLRNDLFANQERQFANIVGVIRTLLHDSDELVLAMGRVPKSDRAGRPFDMLRLSGGSGWEGREPQG